MSIAGLILAAGEGRRFGGPKAVALLHGERLVDRAVRLVRDAGCEPVVVSGAADLDADGTRIVHNPDWRSGMGSSLRTGIEAVAGAAGADAVDALVVVLVDQPWLGAEAIRRLRAARVAGAPVAIATYGGRRRHPVLFGRETWAEVSRSAQGDTGARGYLRSHARLVVEVPCDGTGRPDDVDRPEDLPGR